MIHLPESRRASSRRVGGTLLSVMLHMAIVGAAVAATASRQTHAGVAAPDRSTRVIYVPIDQVRPRVASARPAPRRRTEPRIDRTGSPPAIEWKVTSSVTPTVPSPTLPAAWTEPASDDGDAGAQESGASGGVPGEGGTADGRSFSASEVDRVAELAGRIVPPRYPDVLRRSAVDGRIVVRFIVDTSGRVEPESIVALESAHELFAAAAIASVRKLRFTPARADGRRVRMMMELPFLFTVR